jgi:hypothetical protein
VTISPGLHHLVTISPGLHHLVTISLGLHHLVMISPGALHHPVTISLGLHHLVTISLGLHHLVTISLGLHWIHRRRLHPHSLPNLLPWKLRLHHLQMRIPSLWPAVCVAMVILMPVPKKKHLLL